MKSCLDCGLPVSKPWVRRCRACNGHRMRVQHRVKRALRAGVLSVNARAARRGLKRMELRGGAVEARQAHNLEVAGSIPALATKSRGTVSNA